MYSNGAIWWPAAAQPDPVHLHFLLVSTHFLCFYSGTFKLLKMSSLLYITAYLCFLGAQGILQGESFVSTTVEKLVKLTVCLLK